MILHYLKIALRNLLKNQTQSVISILGLAVGFTCIALSMFWNHYEMTYDDFQSNADRIYRVRYTTTMSINKRVSSITPGPLAAHLVNTYPEVEAACAIQGGYKREWTADDRTFLLGNLHITPETVRIFDFEWLDGDKNIAQWGNKVAITDAAARRLFGEASPIGKKLKPQYGEKEYEITAVVKEWPEHTNISFDLLSLLTVEKEWNVSAYSTYLMLKQNADKDRFIRKVTKDTISQDGYRCAFDVITPLKKLRYTHPEQQQNVTLEHVRMFTIASLLVVLAALLNYLTLFISRLRSKGRQMALRTICGSSGWQLSLLLMTEYILLLLISLLVSLLLIEVTMKSFIELADINVDRFQIYQACGLFILYIIAFASLLSFIPIYYFKKQTIYAYIYSIGSYTNKNRFRQVSVYIQLTVSFLFLFCSTVMIKQLYFLNHSDIGMHRKQIGWVTSNIDRERIVNILEQLPMINHTVKTNDPIFPVGNGFSYNSVSEWEGKSAHDNPVDFQIIEMNDDIANFYGLKMKEGANSFDVERGELIINETLAKALNMEQPIGKMVAELRIKGVVYDFCCQPPTLPVPCIGLTKTGNSSNLVAFSYDGEWKNCKNAITEALQAEPSQRYLIMKDAEEAYNEYIVSERNLLKLLGSITIVSILISLFGVYALMIQSCEQRRKEIAIRKVNGARISTILSLFFKEYFLQVIISALVAFPIGYVLMKKWLENYYRQIDINLWIFVSIFLGITFLVIISIGWRVWKAANQNPAEVIKSE